MIIINTLIRCSSSEAMVREVYLSMFIAATRGGINFLGRPLSGENWLNMTSGFLHKALIVYITVPTTITIITTITTVIATIIATKVSSSIARKSCFDRNWPWRWEQSHAEWKVFSFSPWTFQHFKACFLFQHLRKPTLSNAGGPQTGEGSTIPKALTDVWWEVLVDDKLVTTLEITSMVTSETTMATTSVIT